jgi:hypothetical protein
MIGLTSAGARPIPRGGPWPPAADPAGLNGDAGLRPTGPRECALESRTCLGQAPTAGGGRGPFLFLRMGGPGPGPGDCDRQRNVTSLARLHPWAHTSTANG